VIRAGEHHRRGAQLTAAKALVGFVGSARDSSATRGEGAQNLLCAYLAGAVFLGLAGNAFGWLWLDPIAALPIAGIAVRQGVETWRGEGCRAAPSFNPSAASDDGCCD